MTKTSTTPSITITIDGKDQKVDIDLPDLINKAKERSLSNDEIQRILNYLLNK